MRRNWTMVAGIAGAVAGGAAGQEVELKNDGLVIGSPGEVVVQGGFVNGEIGASTLFVDPSMFPVRVTRVRIFWASESLSAPPSVQDAILIWAGTPSSGRLVYESDPLQLTDGAFNEFDLSAENLVIDEPSIPAISVGLRFSDAPDCLPPPFPCPKPSLVSDRDGCQAGLNPLFAIPGGWTDLCAFGASGDFAIRAIVEPVDVPCYADCDESGELDFFDFLCFQNLFAAGEPEADCDESGDLDFFDFLCFQNAFAAGCP